NFNTYTGSATYNYRKLSVDKTETLEAKSIIIELPVGLRHSFFLTDASRIFINASYNFNFLKTSEIKTQDTNNVKLDKFKDLSPGFAFGIGYGYRKFSGELRFYNKIDLDDYVY